MAKNIFTFLLLLASSVLAAAGRQHGSGTYATSQIVYENRTIDEIYQAALAEGGVVQMWHGGDERLSRQAMKEAFERRFPGMTLNITINRSKYHEINVDEQVSDGAVSVDSVFLQTLHAFPRWRDQAFLLSYAPKNFDKIHPEWRDGSATFYGVYMFFWSNVWSSTKIGDITPPKNFSDYLKPEFKDKLVLTYPNDDDAVLYAFELIEKHYGKQWFNALVKQNPRWVRGFSTSATLTGQLNNTYVASFTTTVGLAPRPIYNISLPADAEFVSWPQHAAILKNAPHPEGAKLLLNWVLSEEYQRTTNTWSTRTDLSPPAGFPDILDIPNTDTLAFKTWLQNRTNVEYRRTYYEQKIGTPQGVSPLDDGI